MLRTGRAREDVACMPPRARSEHITWRTAGLLVRAVSLLQLSVKRARASVGSRSTRSRTGTSRIKDVVEESNSAGSRRSGGASGSTKKWDKVRALLKAIVRMERADRNSEARALLMLRNARARAHQLRWRVTISVFAVTSVVLIAGMVLMLLELFGITDEEELVALPYVLMPSIALLAVLPTDVHSIGPAALLLAYTSLFYVATSVVSVTVTSSDLFQAALFLMLGSISLIAALCLAPIYLRRKRVGSRRTLRNIWLVVHATQISTAIGYVVWGSMRAATCDNPNGCRKSISIGERGYQIDISIAGRDLPVCKQCGHFVEHLLMALIPAVCLIVVIFLTQPTMRNRIHGLLARLSQMGETEAAAAIAAALVAPRTAEEALELAKSQFRSLPLSALEESDLISNEDTGMNERTLPALLGTVDAFVSHSWQDAGSHKYAQLEQWGGEFQRKHGRPPKLWLDKACIDQANIDDNLAALPVFLSGCRQMILLIGPSYMTRLWCIMEMFVFLKMGGDPGRVTVLLVGDDGVVPLSDALLSDLAVRLQTSLQAFDVRAAHCAVANDQERLLGVIESAFVDLRSFNSTVRLMFGRIVTESLACSRGESVGSTYGLRSRSKSRTTSRCTRKLGKRLTREPSVKEDARITRGVSTHRMVEQDPLRVSRAV